MNRQSRLILVLLQKSQHLQLCLGLIPNRHSGILEAPYYFSNNIRLIPNKRNRCDLGSLPRGRYFQGCQFLRFNLQVIVALRAG